MQSVANFSKSRTPYSDLSIAQRKKMDPTELAYLKYLEMQYEEEDKAKEDRRNQQLGLAHASNIRGTVNTGLAGVRELRGWGKFLGMGS